MVCPCHQEDRLACMWCTVWLRVEESDEGQQKNLVFNRHCGLDGDWDHNTCERGHQSTPMSDKGYGNDFVRTCLVPTGVGESVGAAPGSRRPPRGTFPCHLPAPSQTPQPPLLSTAQWQWCDRYMYKPCHWVAAVTSGWCDIHSPSCK